MNSRQCTLAYTLRYVSPKIELPIHNSYVGYEDNANARGSCAYASVNFHSWIRYNDPFIIFIIWRKFSHDSDANLADENQLTVTVQRRRFKRKSRRQSRPALRRLRSTSSKKLCPTSRAAENKERRRKR